MSYRDPGDSYIPPPPPKPKRSPWMFVGIGCGILTLLVVAAFGVLAYQIKEEIRKHPFDPAANRQAMGDTPVYPGSVLDEEMTQAQHAGLRMGRAFGSLKADSIATETRLTPEPIDEIQDYYWRIMTTRRYKSIPQPEFGGARAVLYRKDKDALLVQVQPVPKVGGNAIVLMRFTNLQDDIGEEFETGPEMQLETTEISPGKVVKQKEVSLPTKVQDITEKEKPGK